MNSQLISFDSINQQALLYSQSLLQSWLPNGVIQGRDYCPLNPTRNDKHIGSFKINIQTGQWHDFATGDKGGSLIDLYAYINNISKKESSEYIAKQLNMTGITNMSSLNFLNYKKENKYVALTLPENFEYGIAQGASCSWAYKNLNGEILLVTDRYDPKNDTGKRIIPRCFVDDQTEGKTGWIQKKFLDYNPLYNLEDFNNKANLPILIVEGEKTCEAAKQLYGEKFWCTTWLGGSNGTAKVNTDMITNRKIYMIPDNDDTGRKAMKNLASKLLPKNSVFMVNYPSFEFPPAWDIADAFPTNWDKEKFQSYIDSATPYLLQQPPSTNTKPIKENEVRLTEDVEPYAGNVNGLELVNELISIIKSHIILKENEAVAIAYWILQTYNIEAFTFAPRLLIISPEKRCGKSTLLQLLELLCYRSWPVGNCTSAVLFRMIEKEQPTVLIDEADSFFHKSSEMRNIIDVGFQKKFNVMRSAGMNFEQVKLYRVFSMMAIASINNLSDTIMDRGIKIEMKRKLTEENIQPLRARAQETRFQQIKQKCRKLMLDIGEQAGSIFIDYIEGLSDRACNVWEGIIAIATLIGDRERAICAAKEIYISSSDDTESIKNILLRHILKIFENHNFEDISSSVLVSDLISIDGGPWSEYPNGKPLTAHKLARLLKEYKIRTFQKNVNGSNTNHYRYSCFTEIFERYIPTEFRAINSKNITDIFEKEKTDPDFGNFN
jgi:hypothetical protein